MTEKELLYQITKIIAESDSIGEGFYYCPNYSRKMFEFDSSCDLHDNDSYIFFGRQILDLVVKYIKENKNDRPMET